MIYLGNNDLELAYLGNTAVESIYLGSEKIWPEHLGVDLGLSVIWATCNVGASTPTAYGDYYAWGEIHTKTSYTEANAETAGLNLGDISGNATYDVARALWGAPWRMPTNDEVEELIDKCSWSWSKTGITFTANNTSIIIPSAGNMYGSTVENEGINIYMWSSTLSGIYDAYYMDGTDNHLYTIYDNRGFGCSVRPVKDK